MNQFTPSREAGGKMNSLFLVLPPPIPFKDSEPCSVPTPTQCHWGLSRPPLSQGWEKPPWTSAISEAGCQVFLTVALMSAKPATPQSAEQAAPGDKNRRNEAVRLLTRHLGVICQLSQKFTVEVHNIGLARQLDYFLRTPEFKTVPSY